MRTPRPVKPELEAAIRKAAADGTTKFALAIQLDVSYETIRVLAKRLGVEFVNGNVKRCGKTLSAVEAGRPSRRKAPPAQLRVPTKDERHWAGMKAQYRW